MSALSDDIITHRLKTRGNCKQRAHSESDSQNEKFAQLSLKTEIKIFNLTEIFMDILLTSPSAWTCIVRSTVKRFGTFETLQAVDMKATVIGKHFKTKFPGTGSGRWYTINYKMLYILSCMC